MKQLFGSQVRLALYSRIGHVRVMHLVFSRLHHAHIFLDNTLLGHAFAPLFLFPILVPEAVKYHILSLAARIVFPYYI